MDLHKGGKLSFGNLILTIIKGPKFLQKILFFSLHICYHVRTFVKLKMERKGSHFKHHLTVGSTFRLKPKSCWANSNPKITTYTVNMELQF